MATRGLAQTVLMESDHGRVDLAHKGVVNSMVYQQLYAGEALTQEMENVDTYDHTPNPEPSQVPTPRFGG